VQNFSVGPTQSGDVAWEGFGAAMERVGIKIGHTSGAAPIVPNVAQPARAIALSAAPGGNAGVHRWKSPLVVLVRRWTFLALKMGFF
jgi:hypothetical protein